MGQIQNAINQVFTSALGAGLAYQHSSYKKEQDFQKEGARKASALNERLGQLEQSSQIKPEDVYIDVSQNLPLRPKSLKDTDTPGEKGIKRIEEAVKKYETEGNEAVDERIRRETKQQSAEYKPYFTERKELSEEYNTLMARLGKEERKDLGEIVQQENMLSQTISGELRKAYTTKEGILNSMKLRREYMKEQEKIKEANNG